MTNEKINEDIDSPEIWFTCPELTYFDLIVEVKDLNSIEKIRDRLSDVISGGESESTAHLVLGGLSHFKEKRLDSNYVSIESSDVDDFDFSIENKGRLITTPKKGEVVFVFFYYYDHADYVLTKNENFNNICFKIKSFNNEAVLTEWDYSGFELTANDASGGGELRLEILCNNRQSFEGTVADKEDLIEEFHDYLIEKEEINQTGGDMTEKDNKDAGFVVKVSLGNIMISLDDWDDFGKDDDDNFTQKAKDFAVRHMIDFVEELGNKLGGSIGGKVLVNESGVDFHELNESLSDIDFDYYDDVCLYILIKKGIFMGPNPVNKIFRDMPEFGQFSAIFPTFHENLVRQNYDWGEYDTGFYADWVPKEHYIIALAKEDGSFKPNDEQPHYEEVIKTYNNAVEILKE